MAISAGMALLSTATTAISGGALLGGFLVGGAGTLVSHFLVTTAIGAAINALTPKPSLDTSNRGYSVTQTSSVADHQVVYGRKKVAGVRVFDGTTGTENASLHRVIAFTGHEIESFDEIYLNDEKVILNEYGQVISPSRYYQHVTIKTKLGSPDQQAIPELVYSNVGWTNDHRLRGIAYLYVRFEFNPDVFPNGVPEVTATIRGKRVYDPRTGTTYWSDNPALCVRDYISDPRYGLGETLDAIDDNLFIHAAAVCDYYNYPVWDGPKRYTLNGSFTTGSAPYDILNSMLSSMGGLLWYAQGKWRVKPAYWTEPVASFNEDDLRSSISVNTRHSRRDNFNIVNGTWVGEGSNWQETDFPPVSNQAFIDADNGQEKSADLSLLFTSDVYMARRIARIFLERNRQQLTVQASFGMRAFQVQVGDNIKLTNSRFGWVDKNFEVVSWTFGLVEGEDLQVHMTLREISESVFDEVDDGAVYETDNTTLLDAFDIQPPGITLSSDLKVINEQVSAALKVTLARGGSSFVDFYDVEYKESSSQDWVFVGRSGELNYEIPLLNDGLYDVRARTTNTFGVRSEWHTVEGWYVSAFSTPPSDVQNFYGNVVGNTLHLSWEPVLDLDLSHYKIRYAKETSGASYQNAVDLVPKVARPGVSVSVPARTGTYFIRAVDKLGYVSDNPTSFVVSTNISSVEDLNVVSTLEEHPDFSGNKTGVRLVDGGGTPYITLDSGGLTGTYEFSDYIDLGEKYTSRVSVDLTTLFLDYATTFDDAEGLFDFKTGSFDGDPTKADFTSVEAQVSFTDDDPSGSPTWSPWQSITVSDITARAIRFRVILSSQLTSAAPAVTSLSAVVDMPDRLESESDITYTGSYTVSFPSPFKATPSLGVAATLADGDRYVISGKDRSGFTITTYTGASVSTNPTTIDYVAKGYGKETV